MKNKKMGKMRHVLLLLAFLISGTIPQPVYAYQDTVCHVMTSDSGRRTDVSLSSWRTRIWKYMDGGCIRAYP